MLTAEQNELVTRTGPATPGGAMLRRYWQPVALAEELAGHGDPIPVRILSEDLVLFRDETGAPALLGLRCPHRQTDLSYGRVEDGGLRCVYHGWLFAKDGRCLEQPGEPPDSTFANRVRHTAYPCVEAGGLILAYMGGGEPPPLPGLPFLRAPSDHTFCTKILHECNYLQGNEGNIDPQHVSFLHRLKAPRRQNDRSAEVIYGDVAPTITIEESPFGFRTYARRHVDESTDMVRVTNFIMPNLSAFVGTARVNPAVAPRDENDGCQHHWHVPIDDTHHWKYLIVHRYGGPVDREYVAAECRIDMDAPYVPHRNRSNRYEQDRDEMRSGTTFIGMGTRFQLHDKFATESQGSISDRSLEHLATTDRGVITMRRLLLEAIDEVSAGNEPLMIDRTGSDPLADMVVRAAYVPRNAETLGFWRSASLA
jgi:phenylpropionate dioxygenase-like ring-hydroxylating dioxygenase large terminal subunit